MGIGERESRRGWGQQLVVRGQLHSPMVKLVMRVAHVAPIRARCFNSKRTSFHVALELEHVESVDLRSEVRKADAVLPVFARAGQRSDTLKRVARRGRCRLLFLLGVQHIVPCWQAPAWDRAPAAEPARSSRQLEQLAQLGVGGTRSSPSAGGARRRAAGAVLVCRWRLARRETPGRHVLVVGAPGVLVAEIADLLREREAERREPLDQPREVLLVQRLQMVRAAQASPDSVTL